MRTAFEVRQQQAAPPAQECLIRYGRDSLGRGLDPGSITAAAAADTGLQRWNAAPARYLEHAYRGPHAAYTSLIELVQAQGWNGTATDRGRLTDLADFLARMECSPGAQRNFVGRMPSQRRGRWARA